MTRLQDKQLQAAMQQSVDDSIVSGSSSAPLSPPSFPLGPSNPSTGLSSSGDVSEIATPLSRPRRSVAGPKDYSTPFNLDGTIKKPSKTKEKSSSGKLSTRARTSSVNAAQSSEKGSQAETAIVVDDEEGFVDSDEEVAAHSRKQRKGRLQESDDEEGLPDEAIRSSSQLINERKADEETMIQIPIKKGRASAKRSSTQGTVIEVVIDVEKDNQPSVEEEVEEEEEEHDIRQSKTIEDSVQPPNSGSKDKKRVLADASSKANTGHRKSNKKEEKKVSSSSSSTTSSSTILDAAKRFWGKPLNSLLASRKSRSPGLTKRKVAPLLAIRNEPPAKRAAIPIPKSKRPKGEQLDSDEEAARANETLEERTARFIRESRDNDPD